MSCSDLMRRLQINAPKVTNLQMQAPDVSSVVWRNKLATTVVSRYQDHVINNTTDVNSISKQIQSFAGKTGKNQDVSSYVISRGARAIGQDNFSGRIQTVTTNTAGNCLTVPPPSQIVSELRGNSDSSKVGLNMGYTLCKHPIFNPLEKSQFVDTLPNIKRGLGVLSAEYRANAALPTTGVQLPLGACTTVFTANNITPKAIQPIGKPDVPYNIEKARLQTAQTGSQTGGGIISGARAPKTGAALPTHKFDITHRGVAGRTRVPAGPYRPNNGMRPRKI